MKTTVLRLNKDHYSNGKTSGQFFKQAIQNAIDDYARAITDPAVWRKCQLVLDKLQKIYPEYVDEAKGKAAGAAVDFKAYWAMMCPEIIGRKRVEHCTTIICKDAEGKYSLSHNEDGHFQLDNFCLAKISQGDDWLVTNDGGDSKGSMPFGNGFSWNSHGIVKTINYCNEPSAVTGNIPSYFLQRHISDARSIDDLINRCHDFRPASGFHVNALDRNSNTAVSIEVYPDGVDVVYIDDSYIHSNHYIRGKYINQPHLDKGSNSIFRLYKARELMDKLNNRDISSLRQVLGYRDALNRYSYSIFQNAKDPYVTGMNFSYSVADPDKVYLDVHLFNEKLVLDYDI
jgi:hypothetical protein